MINFNYLIYMNYSSLLNEENRLDMHLKIIIKIIIKNK